MTITSTWARAGYRRGPGAAGLVIMALLGWAGPAPGQTPTPSPAALQAHSQITSYDGPATCIACHQQQAQQMFGSVHYQEMAETPSVPNIDGPAGKGRNGAMVMNSYCGTPVTSSRATCATCHAGNGRIPSPQMTAEQLANIDCMLCHQDAYKRVPAPPYQTVTMPGPNGTTHTIQTVVEDETGFDFIPDTAKMAIPLLDAARAVHLPTRASCLRCHAGAGGSDGGKRGDLSTVTTDPPLTSDVHMSSQGANLACASCHSAGGHRVMGRGVDLRPSDSPIQMDCTSCHTARPHADYVARDGKTRDVHAGRVACQTCHIPAFAKDKSTEMQRDWTHAEFSLAACRGQGGWVPSEVRASNVAPTYQWFDGTSLANVLGQVPLQNTQGEYVLALPNGSVQSPGAKLYPMKLHRSNSARHDATGLLIPHSTFGYFTSGDFASAVAQGQVLSGLDGPASVVTVEEYQTINHGVEAKANALQCGACHAAYTTGGPLRLNLQADLGYALKGTLSQICSQCHGSKASRGFAWDHDYHVRQRGYDCSSCHDFSRAERGLTRVSSIKPAAPGGPAAEPTSDTAIQLVWADNSSTEQGFRVERSLNGSTFSEIGTVGAGVTTASDTGLAAGTSYYYRVRAYNATGTSGYSMVGRATPVVTTPGGSVPAAPTALTATAVSATQVNLVWTDNAADETGFVIEQSLDNVNFAPIASVGANATSFANTGLTGSTTYYYRVHAVNNLGSSSNSNTATVTTPTAPPTAPAAPTNLAASAGDARVTLTWAASTGATSYNVKRATVSGGSYTTLATGVTATSYVDTTVANGTTYYYVVSAVNAGGQSPNSSQVSATPQAPTPTAPPAPTGLTATAGDRRVTLGWTASAGATSYNVKRATVSGGSYTTLATGVTATSYVDTTVANGTTYYYVVSAVNAGGQSPNSSQVSATPQAPTPTAPPAPTGLTATAGDRRVTLGWTASADATSYNVKRATVSGGSYTTLATGVTATSYVDTTVANGTTYYYVVSAVNAGGQSPNSSQLSATPQAPTPTAPPAPTGLTATAGDRRVTLGWTASADATSYNVKRATVSGGSYTTLATGVTATSYVDTTVANGTTYYYVVSAVNAGGQSPNSSQLSATPQAPTPTAPPAPTGLTATAGDRRVTLGWTASAGATSYNVKRATVSGGSYTTLATGVTATSYVDTTVANGTTYYYVVSAVNAGGQSPNSSQVSATPQAPTPTAPPAPTGLTATAGDRRVTLGWTASADATSYNVKRATVSGGSYTTLATGVTATSYVDTTVANGTTYYYVVSAVNAGGQSPNSSQLSATPSAATTLVRAPTGLRAEVGDTRVIRLEWEQSTSTDIRYNKVYRATTPYGPYALRATLSRIQKYRDTNVNYGQTYYYVVTAVNSKGQESPYSNESSARAGGSVSITRN